MNQQLQNYLRRTDAALRANDAMGAFRIADEAAIQGIEHPGLMALAARCRMEDGRDAEALALVMRARALDGRNPEVLNAYGLCLVKLGRAREALAVYDAALAILPGAAAALRFNKGMAHENLGETDLARGELEAVIAQMPDHSEALAWLAAWAAARNDAAVARAYGERALALAPGLVAASVALAAADFAQKDFAPAAARLRALLEDRGLSPLNRAVAQGLLGDVLDAQDRPGEAFAFYTGANATLRALYAPLFESAERESAVARVRRLTDSFRAAAHWRAEPPQSADERLTHVFLVGFPRSGTTLLEQVLAAHPDIAAMEERDALADARNEFLVPPDGLVRLAGLSGAALEPWRAAYWRRAADYGHRPSKGVFIDKMPLNSVVLPLIAKLFPAAKILFALRDPRDVVFSCFRRRFAMTAQMYEFTTLETAAAYYDAVMGLAGLARTRLELALIETRHEDLIGDFEGETRRLCGFLGVAWSPQMKDFAVRARTSNINTPSGKQLAGGLSRQFAGQWRRYAGELAPILPSLAPWVAKLGYPEI